MRQMQNIGNQRGFIGILTLLTGILALIGWRYLALTITLLRLSFKLLIFFLIWGSYGVAIYYFFTTVSGIVSGMGNALGALPNEFHIAASWVTPPNFSLFMQGVIAIWFASLFFKVKVKFLDYMQGSI